MWRRVIRLLTYIFALVCITACSGDFGTRVSELLNESSSFILMGRYNLHDVVYRQLTFGANCSQLDKDSTEFVFTEYDLRALGEVTSQVFEERGFKIDVDTMRARLDSIFGVKMRRSSSCVLNYNRIRLFLVDTVFVPAPHKGVEVNKIQQKSVIFYDEQSGLILPYRCVPEIKDVYAVFPDFIEAEKEMDWLTLKWGEDVDVLRNRKRIVDAVYHMNRYFYSGSEESIKWMCKNAPEIVQVLFVEFRIENDPAINKYIMDRVRARDISIESLIAEKNEDGTLHIRDSLLTFLMNNPTHAKLNRTTIHQCLMGYLGVDIYSDKYERFPDILLKTFNQNERREIVGHILNMVFKSYDMSVRDLFMHEAIELDEGLLQYYTDNDYFGLDYLRRGIAVYRMRFLSDHWSVIGQ